MRKLIGIRKVDIPPTFTKEELDEMGAKIDKWNETRHYTKDGMERDDTSSTGFKQRYGGGRSGENQRETQASKKAGFEAEHTGENTSTDNGGNVTPNGGNVTPTNGATDANGNTNVTTPNGTDVQNAGNGDTNTNAGTNSGNGGNNVGGGNVTGGTTTPNNTTNVSGTTTPTTTTPTTPTGTTTTTPGGTTTTTTPNTGATDNGEDKTQTDGTNMDKPNGTTTTATAPTDEEILKLQKWIDDSYNKRKQENEDDQRRARRNLLLSSIADGLNAMHRAYTHSRGINAMPGSERIMSEKYRERLDKLKASKGKISEDYQNMLLKLRNAKTAQERADAYAEYMSTMGGVKQQNADTKKEDTEKANKRKDDVSSAKIKELEARTKKAEEEAAILRQKLRNMENGLTPDGKPTTSTSRGNGSSNSGSNGSRKGSGSVTGSNKKQKPMTISQRATKYRNEDPEGWEKAKEKAGRKASQTDVVSQYEYMHPNGNGKGGKIPTRVNWL